MAYAQVQKLREACGMVPDAQEPSDAPQLEGAELVPLRNLVSRVCGQLEYIF